MLKVWVGKAMLVGVLAALGAVIALALLPARPTAEVRLVVGSQDLAAQRVPGYSTAAVSLAETFARYVSEENLTLPKGVDTMEATAVPTTPVIRVRVSAEGSKAALEGATSVAEQLVQAAGSGDEASTVSRQRDALLAAMKTKREAQAALDKATRADKPARADELAVAIAQVNALDQAYRDAVAGNASEALSLTILGKAAETTSQVPKALPLGALLGGALGLALLAGLSMYREYAAARS